MSRNNSELPKQSAPFQNTLARGLSRFFIIALAFLLITDLLMFFIKGKIHPLFEDLTKIMMGAFVGMVSTVIAFYFGDANVRASPQTRQMIRDDIDQREQTPTNEQSDQENT